jgi:hypothetical protein
MQRLFFNKPQPAFPLYLRLPFGVKRKAKPSTFAKATADLPAVTLVKAGKARLTQLCLKKMNSSHFIKRAGKFGTSTNHK